MLDLMLSGMSGEDILPQIQGIPVIVVSAKTAVEDKVELLLGGAVDYLTKPFDTKELLARIAVRLREKSSPRLFPVYTYEELTIDTASHSACVAGKQVIAKSVLLDRISMDTPDCTENSLKTHISHLRSKLREASGKDYVESVWGIGFRLKGTS